MSTIDTSCFAIPPEKESGAGERNLVKTPSCGSSTSHLIVSEIMNDILDNAFEVIMAKSLQQPPKIEKITPNVVGDIIENILSPSPNTASSENYRQDETILLDDEIKRIIKEMKYPPDQKNIICTQGVGDQLGEKAPQVTPDKLVEPVKRNTLERKNRLTNLVRNSKQMLAKLVTNETENEMRITKSEEIHEKLLKVIDLEGDSHKHFAEAGSSSSTGILRMPRDSSMDMVDLEPTVEGVDGDTNTEEGRELKESADVKDDEKKCVNVNKKKWNLGSKILKYIKRNKEGKRE